MDSKLLGRLQRLCSQKECCTSDLRLKALKALDGNAEAAEEIMSSLVADKYVDDARFAGAFARDKASLGGWGPAKIRYALRAKGISMSDIEDALSSIDWESADARLDRLLQAKDKTLEGDPHRRLKLIKYLLGRGYEYEAVEKALKRR